MKSSEEKRNKILKANDVLFLIDYVERIKNLTNNYTDEKILSNTNLIYDTITDYYRDIKELYGMFVDDCKNLKKNIYLNKIYNPCDTTMLELNREFFDNLILDYPKLISEIKRVYFVFSLDGQLNENQKEEVSENTIYIGGEYSILSRKCYESKSISEWKRDLSNPKESLKYKEGLLNPTFEEKYSKYNTESDFIANYNGKDIISNIKYLNYMCIRALNVYRNDYRKNLTKETSKIKQLKTV